MLCKHHIIISGRIGESVLYQCLYPLYKAVIQKNNTVLGNMLNIYNLEKEQKEDLGWPVLKFHYCIEKFVWLL